MATHDTAPWIGRMRVLRKPRTTARNARRGYFRSRASGSATPLRPSAWSFSHHAVHAIAARAGWVPSSRVTSRPDPWFPPHDDRAVIEIQILDPQLQTSLIRACPFHTEAGNKRCSPSRKPRMRTTSSGSAPPASAATAEVFRSPEARADPGTAPCRRTARPGQCLTMRGDRNLALVRQPDRNASTSL